MNKLDWLLEEAVRRYLLFHVGKPLDQAWIGLGPATMYKPAVKAGLMKPTFRNPGYDVWWTLTPKGVDVVKSMIRERGVAQ